MTFLNRLKGVGIALAILIGSFVPAFVITVITAPFWSWLESVSSIEAYGHSGPAEWCYLLTYGVIVALCTWFWARSARKPEA